MPSTAETSANSDSSDPCMMALQALASGRLRDWPGLPLGCQRAAAEAALGPSPAGPDNTGLLSGRPTAFRDYPATPTAPAGLKVWYEQDDIIAIQINSPVLNEPLEQALGPAEGTARSLLKAFHTQWIYASRGLTAHVENQTHAVLRLYAYTPMTVNEFMASELSQVENRRIPLRR